MRIYYNLILLKATNNNNYYYLIIFSKLYLNKFYHNIIVFYMNILVTGGAGYVGTLLVKKLLKLNYKVKVIDTFWFGDFIDNHKNLKKIKKNILDLKKKDLNNIDFVIHLAGIANDTASNLKPKLTWEYTCLGTKILCDLSKINKIKGFIFASSSSVYGVKKEKKVHEELVCEPISDYNKAKMVAERIVESYGKFFKTYNIRPATLYGYSPKMRMDLTMNILTGQAANKKEITVFGGKQSRPYLHVNDMVDLYIFFIKYYKKLDAGPYNASAGNLTVLEKAKIISKISNNCNIKIKNIKDIRSYRTDSTKILKQGFIIKENLQKSLKNLYDMFVNKKISNSKRWQSIYWIKKIKC